MNEPAIEQTDTLDFASLAGEFQKSFNYAEDAMTDFSKFYEDIDWDPFNLTSAYHEWLTALANNPQKLLQANLTYLQGAAILYQRGVMNLLGIETEPVIQEQKGDRRFQHEDWVEQPVFSAIKQSYLLASQWMRSIVSDLEGLDENTAKKVKFFTERCIDALSPTNFAATNPAVIEKILAHLDVKVSQPEALLRPPCRAPPQQGLFDKRGTPTVNSFAPWRQPRGNGVARPENWCEWNKCAGGAVVGTNSAP